MNHATTVVMDSEKSRLAAHAIKKRLEELKSPIKLNHAYEALAIAHRHPNWATMKATLDSAPGHEKIPASNTFTLGRRHGSDQPPITILHEDALKHIHCYSPSASSRRKVMERLAMNAIQQGSAAVFIEPVSDEKTKASILDSLMTLAHAHGRRRDLRVLDVSTPSSKVGNGCNILEDEDDPGVCASLIESEYATSFASDIGIAPKYLARAARSILDRGYPLDLEGLLTEFGRLEEEGIPEQALGAYGAESPHQVTGICSRLSRHVQGMRRKYRKIFERSESWEGIPGMFANREIVVIFVSDSENGMLRELRRLVYRSLRRSLRSTRCHGAPGMLLLNDVDLLEEHSDLADAAACSRIVLVAGDQCPTPPDQFHAGAVEIRSLSDAYLHVVGDYVLIGEEEHEIRVGP